jgi:hypothetical protein
MSALGDNKQLDAVIAALERIETRAERLDTRTAMLDERTARLDERSLTIVKAVEGNGMPGLRQRVEDLEAVKNKATGVVAVLGTIGVGIWGFLEWAFHAAGRGNIAPH